MLKKGVFALVFGAFMVAIALPWLSQTIYQAVDYEITSRENTYVEPPLLQDEDRRAFRLR